jgi:hypothetical protein
MPRDCSEWTRKSPPSYTYCVKTSIFWVRCPQAKELGRPLHRRQPRSLCPIHPEDSTATGGHCLAEGTSPIVPSLADLWRPSCRSKGPPQWLPRTGSPALSMSEPLGRPQIRTGLLLASVAIQRPISAVAVARGCSPQGCLPHPLPSLHRHQLLLHR